MSAFVNCLSSPSPLPEPPFGEFLSSNLGFLGWLRRNWTLEKWRLCTTITVEGAGVEFQRVLFPTLPPDCLWLTPCSWCSNYSRIAAYPWENQLSPPLWQCAKQYWERLVLPSSPEVSIYHRVSSAGVPSTHREHCWACTASGPLERVLSGAQPCGKCCCAVWDQVNSLAGHLPVTRCVTDHTLELSASDWGAPMLWDDELLK